MLQYDFEQSVGFWTIMAARAFERAMNAEIAPRGITWRQCQVLGWLALCGDVSQTELAERMMVEGPTLVGILDRMERDGWITRHDHPADRRKKIVRPTDRAEPVWDEISECARRVRMRAIEGLSGDDLATLRRLLNRIETNLREPAGHSSLAPCDVGAAQN